MSEDAKNLIEEHTGIDIGVSDQQIGAGMMITGLGGAGFLATYLIADTLQTRLERMVPQSAMSASDPRERMANQLLRRGHASMDEVLQASYGEWPPKGLDIVSPNSQRVAFGSIAERGKGMEEVTGPLAGIRGRLAAVGGIYGDATMHGDRVIRMNGVKLSMIPRLFGRSALSSTMGHEGVHILQGDSAFRASQIFGHNSWSDVSNSAQMAYGKNDTLARTFGEHANPDFKKFDRFDYLKSGHEVQARIHQIMARGYQHWGRLPANREQFLVAMNDAGLDIPQEVMQDLEKSPTFESTKQIFSSNGAAAGSTMARDINSVQAGLTDAGKADMWNRAAPALYADLIEMYGDGPGRARFDMGHNVRGQIRREMAAAGGPVSAPYQEFTDAYGRDDPAYRRMVKPGADPEADKAKPPSGDKVDTAGPEKPKVTPTGDIPKPGDKVTIDLGNRGSVLKIQGTYVDTVMGDDGKPVYNVDLGEEVMKVSPDEVTNVQRVYPKPVPTTDVPKPGDMVTVDLSAHGSPLKLQGTYVDTVAGDDGRPVYNVDFGKEVMKVSPDDVTHVVPAAPKTVVDTSGNSQQTPEDAVKNHVAGQRALAETRYEIKNGSPEGFTFDDEAKTRSLMKDYEADPDKFKARIESETIELADRKAALTDYKRAYTGFQNDVADMTGAPRRESGGSAIVSSFDRVMEDGGVGKVREAIDAYDVPRGDVEKYLRAETALRVDNMDSTSPTALRGSIAGYQGDELKAKISDTIAEHNERFPARSIDAPDYTAEAAPASVAAEAPEAVVGGTEEAVSGTAAENPNTVADAADEVAEAVTDVADEAKIRPPALLTIPPMPRRTQKLRSMAAIS